MPLFPRRRRRSLTASVSSPLALTEGSLSAAGYRVKKNDAQVMLRLRQQWQAKAFYYYDVVPELKFAAQFYARMLEPLRLFVAKRGEDGEWEEIKLDEAHDEADEVAVAQLDRVQDPGGGRTGILGSYGRLMFIAGEGTLFATRDRETDMETWEVLSTDEVRVSDGSIVRYKAPSILVDEYKEPSDDDWEPLDDESAIAYRLWKRHPRYSWLPDATMMGVLDIAEELVLLTLAVRSRSRSRVAGNGILFIDSKVSPAPPEPAPDEDPLEDKFLVQLTAAMMEPIEDEGSSSAVVPLVVRVPVPDERKLVDMVYHLPLVDPAVLYPETGLRLECVKRLAIGLDMPPEILLGLADSNHWTGWQIEDQTWKAHGLPLAKQFCDDLTQSFFRPSLEAAGIEEWWLYQIGFDESAIVVHPDRSNDVRQGFKDGVVSADAYRDAIDVSDEDAPSQEEHLEWLGIQLRDPSIAMFGIPTVRGGVIEPEPDELVEPGDEEAAPGRGGVKPGPPKESEVAPTEAVEAALFVARIQGAVDLAVLRAREAAGNRLVHLAKRDPAARERLRGVRTASVPATLGRDGVRALRAPSELELVVGCGELVADTLRLYGITDSAIVELVARSVEEHAARTLYVSPAPRIPASFAEYVTGLLASRNGHGGNGASPT